MYCKIFPSQQVYDGIAGMSIACDNVFVTDGWICLYKGEKFVASFDMVTINGWVLIDSTADTPQTDCGKDINVRSKDEPQTLDDIGKQIQDAYDKGFLSDADAVQAWYEAVKDEPQTERSE